MRRFSVLISVLVLLSGCGNGLPSFLGSGQSDGTYRFSPLPVPPPEQISVRSVITEETPGGIIIRVDGFSPTQGYYSAALLEPLSDTPLPPGTYQVDFVATPPVEPNATGPENTRRLRAAVFLPARYLKDIDSVRIYGLNSEHAVNLR